MKFCFLSILFVHPLHNVLATPTLPPVNSFRYVNNLFNEKSLREQTLEKAPQIPSQPAAFLVESYLNDQINYFNNNNE
eukprot:Pgem_evm1s11594